MQHLYQKETGGGNENSEKKENLNFVKQLIQLNSFVKRDPEGYN